MTEEDRNLVPMIRFLIILSTLATGFAYFTLPLSTEHLALFGPGWLFLIMAAWSGTKQ